MITTIKPIETVYQGYRFRSRLEARWACFFDVLDVPYEYEKEGYVLDGLAYLPDFWLPEQQCWVEIKGETPTDIERRKAFLLADATAKPVLMCSGPIGVTWRGGFEEYGEMTQTHTIDVFVGYHSPVLFDLLKGAFWYFGYQFEQCNLEDFLCTEFPREIVPRYDGSRQSVKALVDLDREYYRRKYGREHPHYLYGIQGKGMGLGWKDGLCVTFLPYEVKGRIADAYTVARQARFEHGERGR